MSFVESIDRYFRVPENGGALQPPLPTWKTLSYSLGIVAAFFAGTVLEARLRFTGYGEAFGAVPVLICAAFVLRLPRRPPIRVGWGFRAPLLVLPFVLLVFADVGFPKFSASQAGVWAMVLVQSVGVGVSEELTFRFGLHRLWSSYSALFYVLASSAIFGALHYPLGLQVSVISGFIGVAFAASRVAGMPLIALILLHAFFDAPEFFRSVGVT